LIINNTREIFQKFLEDNSYFIDFNGEDYTLVDKSNNIINITKTPDEMLHFILGYNSCFKKLSEEIILLKEANEGLKLQNETNIKNYEKVILDMGKESLDGDIKSSE